MLNGRKSLLYLALGILLSLSISSFLYFAVYPLTIRTVVTRDTTHQGDLLIAGDQEFIIDNATYFNDGNIVVQDQAKLVLRNAILIINQSDPKSWFGGREPNIDEPISYPLYYLKVRDNARLEAFNAVAKSPTTQHFSVLIQNKATVVLSNTAIDETLYFCDGSSGVISDSHLESMFLTGNSLVSISNSTLPQSVFRLSQNATISIFNSRTTRGTEIEFLQYFGTMYFNQTRLKATLLPQDSSFRVIGSLVFDPGSEISHRVEGNLTYWNWVNSSIIRSFDVDLAYPNGTAAGNLELRICSQLGNLLWTGLTDEKGKANVEIAFTSENFQENFELRVDVNGYSARKYLSLLSSTPVSVLLSGS